MIQLYVLIGMEPCIAAKWNNIKGSNLKYEQ